MKVGDPVYKNGEVVGKICHISKQSFLVKTDGEVVQRFHKFLYGGFLKHMGMIADYDKITDYTLEQTVPEKD